jgi:hypothetical protein
VFGGFVENSIRFSPDGKILAVGDTYLWNVP